MITRTLLPACLLACLGGAHAQAFEQNLSQRYDGQWSVVLACPDVKGDRGLVKGYEYAFVATVAGGKLIAHYGRAGSPASVEFAGSVLVDGRLEIAATGITGRSDYAIGGVAQGTHYTYNLAGKLGQSSGQAIRSQGRSCTATFTRQ